MLPSPVWTALLVKPGEPCDWTLWGTLPVFVQVHVTVPPTATVSTAALADPLCPLLKTLLPTVTAAVDGAGPPPASPPTGAPPPFGLVVVLPEQPASSASATAVRKRLFMNPPF